MKVRIFVYTLAICFISPATPNSAYAETLYAKSSNTKVYEKDYPKSKLIGVVQKGTKVQVLQKTKNFIKVSLSTGEVGWIFKHKLTNSPPKKSSPLSQGSLNLNLDINQDFAARESSSGSSIRAKESKDKTSIGLEKGQ